MNDVGGNVAKNRTAPPAAPPVPGDTQTVNV